MSFKLQIKLSTAGEYNNSNKNYEWHYIKPWNQPDYEYDTIEAAEYSLGLCSAGSNNPENYRVKELL